MGKLKTKYSQSELDEINFILEWTNFIYNFYVETGSEFFKNFIIDKIDTSQYISGLLQGGRESLNDANDSAFDLPKEEFTELNRRLKERFGKTLYDFQKNTDKKIAQIIKRRKIRNEEEFRLAQMHIDRIFQDTEKEEEWKILEDLCFEFEQSVEIS